MPDLCDQPAQIFDGQFPMGKAPENAWEEYRRRSPPGAAVA